MKNRNLVHSDNWATPPRFYQKLDEKYQFDFDPCPYNDTGKLAFNGLNIDWGKMNFINPPYSQKLKDAFVKKAIEETKKGNSSLMLLPVSTSTKLFHDWIKPNCDNIEFVKGRIKFIGINTKGHYVNWDQWERQAPAGVIHVKNSGMHDSMLVLFRGNK